MGKKDKEYIELRNEKPKDHSRCRSVVKPIPKKIICRTLMLMVLGAILISASLLDGLLTPTYRYLVLAFGILIEIPGLYYIV